MAIYNIHAGHAPYGSGGASGAVGILNESTEARRVKDYLIKYLKSEGNTVYDCTCERGYSQNEVLSYIVHECNKHSVDRDISIHLNSGRNDYKGDESTGGVEVWLYDDKIKSDAERICAEISKTLEIRNRGVKYTHNLYVLRKTIAPAMLIECCFVDDRDDAKRWNEKKCAQAIYRGLTGSAVQNPSTTIPTVKQWKSSLHYRVYSQTTGLESVKESGEVAGVLGKRLEGLFIDYPNHEITAKVHLQGKGWIDYNKVERTTLIGTKEEGIRMECICLKGDFRYRVYIHNLGWTAWTKADGIATLGSVGQSLAIEMIQIEEI